MDITEGRIFFLGAGFSAGAGVPLTNTLLPKAAELFQQEEPHLYNRVCGYATEVDVDLDGAPETEDFVRLCTHLEFTELREFGGRERWNDNGSKEKLALKFYLSKAIALNTPTETPDLYLKFAQSLTPKDIIVTFNWDLLLEKAIQNLGLEYCYVYEKEKIQIRKLHGSINWINNAPHSASQNRPEFGYRPIGYEGGMMENEVYCSDELLSADRWQNDIFLDSQVEPMIILPGYGKAFDIRQLSALWYRIEMLNLWHGGVSIIGLNVSPDDFIVESLFRYLFRSTFSDEKPVRIINPDKKVGERFQMMAQSNAITIHSENFSEETLKIALFD